MKTRIAIIGGGASGLAAACALGREADVVLYEHTDRVGKKLLVTGAGRCNVMNALMEPLRYMSDSPDAVNRILSGSEERIKAFFKSLGLVLRQEDEGRIYPLANQAASVLDVLRFNAAENGVCTLTDARISSIVKRGNEYAVKDDENGIRIYDKIILACGGRAAPKTGSDGSGFALAQKLGHSVTPLIPVLVPLKSKSPVPKALKGTRCRCCVTLLKNGRSIIANNGEIQFTEYGISGIAAMQLSRYIKGGGCSICVDFAPDCDYGYIMERLLEARKRKRELQDVLVGIVARRCAQQIIKSVCDISLTESSERADDKILERIAHGVKGLVLDIDGTLSWEHAQVTRGGIPLSEINPDTMESVISKGLYIVGEMLNCDGDCGGYNLGWAWITALLAADGCMGKGRA